MKIIGEAKWPSGYRWRYTHDTDAGTITFDNYTPDGALNATETYPAANWRQYLYCAYCGKLLEGYALARALKSFQATPCSSTECAQSLELKRYACCEKARRLSRSCVCTYAIECPEHGERHFGTHD